MSQYYFIIMFSNMYWDNCIWWLHKDKPNPARSYHFTSWMQKIPRHCLCQLVNLMLWNGTPKLDWSKQQDKHLLVVTYVSKNHFIQNL